MGKKTAEKKRAKAASATMTDTGRAIAEVKSAHEKVASKSKGKDKRKGHDSDAAKSSPGRPGAAALGEKISNKAYAREMKKLDVELVKLQQWVVRKGLKLCIVFEGRDGAGRAAPSRRSPTASARACFA